MDREWMYGHRASQQFVDGLFSFIKAAKAYVARNPQNKRSVSCPCRDCKNSKRFRDFDLIFTHLVTRGFMQDYKIWHKHGEKDDNIANDQGGDDESIPVEGGVAQVVLNEPEVPQARGAGGQGWPGRAAPNVHQAGAGQVNILGDNSKDLVHGEGQKAEKGQDY